MQARIEELMTVDAARPWLAQYPAGMPADLRPEHRDALRMFRAAVERAPDQVAVSYFGGEITFRELDAQSDALACAFLARGFARGDRAAAYLQNVPQFVITMVATWKAGGTMVSINPMSRERELQKLLADSGSSVLVCLDDLYETVVRSVVLPGELKALITTSALEHRGHDDPRLFAGMTKTRPEGSLDFAELVAEFEGLRPPPVEFGPDDVALLTYTSGTTGAAKGAMNTHGNVTFTAQVIRDWCGLVPGDVILGVAPLFHITGLIAGIAASFIVPAELVLGYRFDAEVLLDAIRERRPTFTVAAITVFIAIANMPGVTREDLASLRSTYSGGAPVTPAWAGRFLEQFGIRIHSMYGLTETTSPSHAVPFGATAPVDPTSGALSVGVPVPSTVATVVDEDRVELPPGEVGEIVISGPQVVPGYWQKPEESDHAMPGGRLHTGDVGFMDAEGWFYVVDRKKDLINASGYKVWPREVEDVLCEHEAVSEAAVVGVPDEYRGETVKAFVTLRPGASVDEQTLIAFCKARMSAYKYPRSIEFLEALPKTSTGKVLRRELPRTASDAG
jgi:long-chain acyl-CoA synthetase